MRPRFLRSLLPVLVLAALPTVSSAGVFIGVSVNVPPPPLPVYVQPPCPQPGYIWTPGYWAWGPYGYYWVPGTWVLPPEVGLLWTPGWWGWDGDRDDYIWHAGYWGPRVGFYGGIDYGYGYDGVGFVGGYWRGGIFFYNRDVVRVGRGFEGNVYRRRYHRFHHAHDRYVSFNGGRGGIRAHPTRRDLLAERDRRFHFTPLQRRHLDMARHERVLRAKFNHGRPPIAATTRPVDFHGHGVYGARAAGGRMRVRDHSPARGRAPMQRMRSDRPPWATGQRHASHQVLRNSSHERRFPTSGAGGRHYQRPAQHYQRPAQRYQRPVRHYQRPARHYQRPARHYQRPARHYQRPVQRFQRPVQRFQRPVQRFQRPVQRFQRPVRHYQRPQQVQRRPAGHGRGPDHRR